MQKLDLLEVEWSRDRGNHISCDASSERAPGRVHVQAKCTSLCAPPEQLSESMSHAVDVAVHSDSLRDQSSPMSSDSFDPNAMPVTHLSSASCCAHAGDSCNRCVAWARVHPRIVWGIVLVVVVGGGLLVAVSLLPIDKWMHSSQDYIAANQAASIAVLFAAMFVGVMVFLPVSLIETAGSFFFGWKIGFPVTLGGYWLGSMVALLLGRQCCMEYVVHCLSVFFLFRHLKVKSFFLLQLRQVLYLVRWTTRRCV